jgi:glycosyltransferase involved in cell wall biosynthesis
MSVSIIIPMYNSSLLVKRAIQSVVQQKEQIIKEIILIDDGCTDDTVEVIKRLSIPKLILIRQSNQGPAAARNKGIEIAKGRYIAFLDADDYWKPGFLSETYAFLEEHNEAIAVSAGQIHKFPGKEDWTIPSFLTTSESNIKHPILIDNFYEFWSKNNHVCTGSVLMRSDVVKKTKGQRVDLRITEDIEFWAYLATFGQWGFIPKILFVSDGGKITQQIGWQNKNHIRWSSATSLDNWEKRIIKNIPPRLLASYEKSRGRIAKRLSYSMILSNREKAALEMVKEYGIHFPKDKLSKILKFASHHIILWRIICNLVVLKEKYRKI